MLDKTTSYSLKVILFLVGYSNPEYVTLDDVARRTGVPRGYLGRLINLLQKDGYVKTKRGVKGGVMLNVDPDEILFRDLLEYFGVFNHTGNPGEAGCCVGPSFARCPVEDLEKTIRHELLGEKTLRDIHEEFVEHDSQ